MSGRLTAHDRVRRLLAIIPWIAGRDGPTLADVCAHFGIGRAQLLSDLEVVFLVGIHPFTPDALIDVVIEDGRVWINLAPGAFNRPLRLTPEQGLALVAAGSSLLSVPGSDSDGPLARGLAKLGRLLGIDEQDAVAITLGSARQEVLDLLRRAVAEHRPVHLRYYAYGRDAHTERTIEPWLVYADAGQWYVSAFCRRAGGERLFRVDRIEDVELLDETFEPPDHLPDPATYHPHHDDPRITLLLTGQAAWVPDHYAVELAEPAGDGRLRVRLAVSATPWLERLLLRLGDAVEIESADPPLQRDLGRAAARRVLSRYVP